MKLSVKKGRLVFTGKIRCYEGDSDRLGYHIRQGKPEFDSWWLNENGFREISSLTLPQCFPKQKRFQTLLARSETVSAKVREKESRRNKARFKTENKNGLQAGKEKNVYRASHIRQEVVAYTIVQSD